MQILTMRALFLFSLLLSGYGYARYGAPGLVCGLIIGAFLCFGLGGIVVSNGKFTCGLGGVFIWFLGFVTLMTGMFLFERYWVDGGPIAGKTFGPPNGMYFADKVMTLFGRWVSLGCSPGDYTFAIVFLVAGFVFSALLSGKR